MTYTIYEIGDGDYTASPGQLDRDYAAPVGSIEVIRTPALLVATTWGEHLQVLSDRCVAAWKAGEKQITE